jgi:hypothetical protein
LLPRRLSRANQLDQREWPSSSAAQKKWPSERSRQAIDSVRSWSPWPATARIAQFVTIIDIPFKLEGIEVMLSSHTQLLLRAERREGVWHLSGFDPVYLRDEIVPMIPGQTVTIDLGALNSFRPSYRFLSYCFASVGYPVPNDLAGVDRPDLVDALVREIYGWAGLTPPR